LLFYDLLQLVNNVYIKYYFQHEHARVLVRARTHKYIYIDTRVCVCGGNTIM